MKTYDDSHKLNFLFGSFQLERVSSTFSSLYYAEEFQYYKSSRLT